MQISRKLWKFLRNSLNLSIYFCHHCITAATFIALWAINFLKCKRKFSLTFNQNFWVCFYQLRQILSILLYLGNKKLQPVWLFGTIVRAKLAVLGQTTVEPSLMATSVLWSPHFNGEFFLSQKNGYTFS